MSKLSRAQRRQLIAVMTELVADTINSDHVLILVAIAPDGPQVLSPYPQELALHVLKLVHDSIDWNKLPDPPAGWLDAIGQLQ